MSFSVSLDKGRVEWAGNGLSGIFADRKNIFRLSFYRFLLEILRFNKVASKNLLEYKIANSFQETVDEFLSKNNFSNTFKSQYLYPLTSLIWSAPQGVTGQFPVAFVLEFLSNHNLLSTRPRLPWRSVTGGSAKYIELVVNQIKNHGGTVLTSIKVEKVQRFENKVFVTSKKGKEEFDAIVFGTHANVTLGLLSDATEAEKNILSSFSYQNNIVTAHSDTSLMPVRKKAWSAWNFCDFSESAGNGMSLTYNMNILNGLPEEYPIFVTINPALKIDTEFIHGTFVYFHPLQTVQSKMAQQELKSLQGKNGTYFCGSYFGYGFHEDGFCSGKEVARLLGAHVPWKD